MKWFFYIFSLLILVFTNSILFSQEDIFSKLLEEEVEVIDPQYKPVIGFGVGSLNFFGDVSNKEFKSPLMGSTGFKVTITTFLDSRNHYFKANFLLFQGAISGEAYGIDFDPVGTSNIEIPERINFQTNMIAFGINVNYGFGHFYKKKKHFLNPFISVGLETISGEPQFDIFYGSGESKQEYFYWNDGTIRNIPENNELNQVSQILNRDYKYVTSSDQIEYIEDYQYPGYFFAIPIDIGLDFNISERVSLSIGSSFHILMSDNIDHMSQDIKEGIAPKEKGNDYFRMNYLSLHLDLFSDPTTIIIDKLFADIDFDYTLYDDEDNDMVFDGWDECPDTPAKAQVDSVGCPFDKDKDGVPDYRDEELNTPSGVFVDDDGIQITEDEILAMLERSSNAVRRDEVDLYIRKILGYSKYFGTANLEIPPEYKFVDVDEDGYISFDELLLAIDKFFDFESDLTPDDIYELNSFFFAQ